MRAECGEFPFAASHRQSPQRVGLEQADDQVNAVGCSPLKMVEVHPGHTLADSGHGCLRVSRLEWGVAGHQFVDQHSQAPPVHRHCLPQVPHHLGGEVVWRAAGGEGLLRPDDLGQPHVRQLAAPPVVEEEVLRLQVAVQHALVVQVHEGCDHRGGVELRLGDGPVVPVPVVLVKQLAAEAHLHQEVEVVQVPKRLERAHDETALAQQQNLLLAENRALHALADQKLLANRLQRKRGPRLPVLVEGNAAETPRPEDGALRQRVEPDASPALEHVDVFEDFAFFAAVELRAAPGGAGAQKAVRDR
mmetsp:Transcript_14944/g.37229  ORF Transcript_14944/g.37229 Transcript_14944/m.37229 type:complete len:304 (-) Transcript_14944:1022-1933(-)